MVGSEVVFREAAAGELEAILALIEDDEFSRDRGAVLRGDEAAAAFDEILRHPDHELLVAGDAGEVVACLQLSFLPYLTYGGAPRAQLEYVRVRADHRGGGLGTRFVEWALDRARARGCHLAQLTSDRRRADARAFYERLGFVPSHVGMKLHLG